MSQEKAHILIFPYPAQGHMLPLLDLAHQLSIRGLDITILVTPKNLPLLNPLLCRDPSIQTLVLPFPSHPSIPPGVENVKDLPVGGFRTMMYTLRNLHNPLKEWFKNHVSPPTAIIFDMFLGSANRLADELSIPGYVFSPSGGLALSVIYSLWRHMPKRKDPSSDEENVPLPVPNCPSYPWWQLSPVYRSFADNETDLISKTIKENLDGDMASFGLVINSVSELEGVYMDHLKDFLGHPRVWSVGPVLPPSASGDASGPAERGGASSISASEILTWLDQIEEDHSVIYVCFGSQAVLTNEQMEALTLGLEKSGAKFILSVKGATQGHEESEKYGLIPPGFEERVAGRGLVIKGWAPQVLILRHSAVGAFLTHCGWNSVLEGIGAGVPMLAWPMGADQYSNATLIVNELEVGVRACEGDENVPDSDELAGVLAKAICGFQEERKRAKELQKAAFDAVQEGGSSFKNLDNLALHFSEEASKRQSC
ncbi:UDP-glycosyltransferase 89B2-like [Coffea arabica]|uniref:Glycosyltransferase n=1 Tax=Coffea arabica TaxID=13443 RepID=A0A6P6XBW4_COFAR